MFTNLFKNYNNSQCKQNDANTKATSAFEQVLLQQQWNREFFKKEIIIKGTLLGKLFYAE